MSQSTLHSEKSACPRTFNRWVLVSCLVVVAVAVGFHYGQQVAVSRLTALAQLKITSSGQINKPDLDHDSQSPAPGFPEPLLLKSQVAAKSLTKTEDNSVNSSNSDYEAEIEYLSSTAGRLRKRVASLEWETLTLESDLLTREVELEKALGELDKNNRQRRDVYNIINVPVGGFVVPAQMTGSAAIPISQQTEGHLIAPTISANSQEPIKQNNPIQQKEPFRQPTFFGPAPDRYENLVNPGIVQSPHQARTQEDNLSSSDK